jgi:nucleoside-diphosphate-sugar epimerase
MADLQAGVAFADFWVIKGSFGATGRRDGGCGLSGHLLDRGFHVTVVDDLTAGRPGLFHLCNHPNFDFIRGDARDEKLLKERLKNTDIVIPLAAMVGMPACNRDPERARTVNLEAIRSLIKLRSPSQLIVYPNTNSGYGTKTGQAECTEDSPLEPISLYGQTKVAAELELLQQKNTITLRLATVFGMSPRPRVDLLVNHFVWAAMTDGYLTIFEKAFRRNFVHIRDVADCFIHCIDNAAAMAGKPYNVGLENANLTKEQLALKIKEHIPGFYLHFAEVGSDPDKRDYLVSNARLAKAGFVAKRSLDEGIRELMKGYRMLIGPSEFRNA